MASYRIENRPDSGDLLSWVITVVLLVSPVWPIGLILLLRKLTGGSRRRASRHPFDIQREGGPVPGTQGMPGAQRQTPPVGRQHVGRSPRQGRPVNLDRGKGRTVWGIVLTVIFGIALTGFPAVAMSGGFRSALAVMSPVIGFFGGGLAMLWAGTQRTKQAKRFRKYLALIGRRESLSITTLAQALPAQDKKLHGFAAPDALLVGVETRSSSPVRILRGKDFQSDLRGLYPCGEGAGYAGGIVSAAVAGVRVAEAVAHPPVWTE